MMGRDVGMDSILSQGCLDFTMQQIKAPGMQVSQVPTSKSTFAAMMFIEHLLFAKYSDALHITNNLNFHGDL